MKNLKTELLKKYTLGVREHRTTNFWELDTKPYLAEELLDLITYGFRLGGVKGWTCVICGIIIYKLL